MRQFNERRRKKKRRRAVLLPFKILLGVVLVFAAAYFIIAAYKGLRAPMTTAIASESSINREFSIVGYFVREERVIEKTTDGILLYTVNDGEKLGRHDEYAAVYSNISAAELRSIIRSYEEQIGVLRKALTTISNADSISSLSANIYTGLKNCSALAKDYDYSRLDQYLGDLKTDIIARDMADASAQEVEALIASLTERCETLSAQIGASEISLTTDKAGYFSSQIDGYESVFDADDLSLLRPSDLNRLVSQRRTTDGS